MDRDRVAVDLDVDLSSCRTIAEGFHDIRKRTQVSLGDDAKGFLGSVGVSFAHEFLEVLERAVLHIHEARATRNGDVEVDITPRLLVRV